MGMEYLHYLKFVFSPGYVASAKWWLTRKGSGPGNVPTRASKAPGDFRCSLFVVICAAGALAFWRTKYKIVNIDGEPSV